MKETTRNEAPRRGRRRKGIALRVPMTLSVDPVILEKARALRNAGYPLNDIICLIIMVAYEVAQEDGILKSRE